MTYQLIRSAQPGSVLERFACAASHAWQAGYEQPFIQELRQGVLSQERFTWYMIQDRLYLDDYANVHALAFASCTHSTIRQDLAQALGDIAHELATVHDTYTQVFGISEQRITHAVQSAAARAYTTSMLETAYRGNTLEILVALLPCAWVYADYGARLARELGDAVHGHPYEQWISTYAADDFWDASQWLRDDITLLAQQATEAEIQRLEQMFVQGVDLERVFWASAYEMQAGWNF